MPRKYVRSKPHNKVTPHTIRVLKALKAEGVSVIDIAKTLNLSRFHVYRLLKQYCPEPVPPVSASSAE